MEIPKGYKQTEVGIIPEEWIAAPLSILGEVKMCKRVMKFQTSSSGDVPFYKIGTFGKDPDAFISRKLFKEYKSRFSYPKKGSILLSAAGTIGRTVRFDGEDSYFQDSNIVWIDNDESKVLNDYLYQYYNVIEWKTENGGIVTRLYNENLKATYFAFPASQDEQKRIADAISDVDELIAALNQQIDKKRQIKEGAMQQLLTGKTRLPGFNKQWEEIKLGDICEMASGGTPSSKVSAYYGGNINFLSIGDMTASKKYIYSTEKTITESGLLNSSARVYPPNTLMYAMYASLGKCAISKIETAVSQAILGFTLSQKINIDFLYYHFCFIEDKVKNMGQTGTQSNLSKGLVQEFSLKLPEVEEQVAIAEVLSNMDEEIRQLEAERDKYMLVKQGMMQELLTGKTRLN